MAEIKDLCSFMGSCGMRQDRIGALTDSDKGRKYTVTAQPEQKLDAGEITLARVLQDSYRPRLQRVQRFSIALAVSSSHLRLHSTDWARKQWEASDICFPVDANTKQVMLDRPYVSTSFEARKANAQPAPGGTGPSFVCLGIMLLELVFGMNLEQHDLWHQLGQSHHQNGTFRLMVARHWADSVEGEAGPDCASAVKWCLTESPQTLQGDQWRRDLADKVVLPLEKCCEWIHPSAKS